MTSVFVGWVPTVTGRLSFSRAGDGQTGWSVFCNRTKGHARVAFGVVRRTSRDFPYPAWVARCLDQAPDTDFIVFLHVAPGHLPYPKSNCADAEADDPEVVLRADDRARLVGTIYWINGWKQYQRDRVQPVIDEIKAAALAHSSDHADQNADGCIAAARDVQAQVEELWDTLASIGRSPLGVRGTEIPNFGRASVSLVRTGECRIEINPRHLFTLEEIMRAQRQGVDGELWQTHSDLVDTETATMAEHCFYALRDLHHRHYHHRAEADMSTTPYPTCPGDDASWRRETQYGLVRMAISIRREDSALTYKQALGVIAYAEAFQKHMTSWCMGPGGKAVQSLLRYDYDFAALRASIESSLKVRETNDQSRMRRYVFVVATVFTTISLLSPGVRAYTPEQVAGLTFPAQIFAFSLAFWTRHPLEAAAFAALTAYLLDIAIFRLAVQPVWLEAFGSSLTRFGYGVLADKRRERHGARMSKWSVLFWIGLFVLIIGGAAAALTAAGLWLWIAGAS